MSLGGEGSTYIVCKMSLGGEGNSYIIEDAIVP